jgi:XTP/dITP diphosphohydrolase
MKGSNGFGYDPIFFDYKTEKAAAELSSKVKNRISHRAQALQKLKLKLKMIYD